MPHTSRYPETVRFAKENPLPSTPEAMADALLDIWTILLACVGSQADSWDTLTLSLLHRRSASAYPGAFLSNPAMLLSTTTKGSGSFGGSMGSFGAGCLFSYAHHQEDSLGPALLLCAFSPRTMRSARPARLYAQALGRLMDLGMVESVGGGAYGNGSLAELASGEVPESDFDNASFNMSIGRRHRPALDFLRTDLAGKAIGLALLDDKPGLFDDGARARLLSLAMERAARSEADAIGAIALSPWAGIRSKPPRV